MEKKEEVYGILEKQGIPFETVEHAPVYTMEDMQREGVLRHGTVCKNLFLRDGKGKRHFLVCALADKSVDLKRLGEQIGARLSFASEERLEKHLHLKKGAVTPLGVLYDDEGDVEVFFDRDLAGQQRVGVHPCDNTATVFLRFDDLKRLVENRGNPVAIIEI